MFGVGIGGGRGAEASFRRVPAALLAESLSRAGSDDGGGLGMELAHLVPPVVVLRVCQVGVAPLRLTPRRLGGAAGGLQRAGPAVQPVHEVVFR